MTLYRDKGIVLRSYKLGESDRIVVMMTEHHGVTCQQRDCIVINTYNYDRA
jgi:hypothetical protein